MQAEDAPPAPADELVHLDRIGVPAGRLADAVRRVVALGVTETTRQRLAADGLEAVTENLGEAAGADVVLVSTRLPSPELKAVLAAVRSGVDAPVVVVAHTGGEAVAVDLVRAGAAGVIAEGNEGSVTALLADQPGEEPLLDTYDRQHADGQEDGDSARDDVTGLPGESALRQRLGEYVADGDVPRVAFARVLHLEEALRRMAPAATALLRRRLSARYRELAREAEAELFAVAPTDFAFLSGQLTPHGAEALGRRLAQATETFAPMGHRTLALALGHAGSEVATEVDALRELAERALLVASSGQRSAVVGADVLALGVSSTTELEAAERLVAFVEQHDGHPPGHGERVAAIASAIARELRYDGIARSRVRLAAHLHAVGKAALPVEAMAARKDLDADALWAYRSHPVRGEEYLRLSAGRDVAEAVRHQHERWDGSGFPDGLEREDIPLSARIIAVADRYDGLRHGSAAAPPMPLDAALAALREEAGTRLDPELVGLAVSLLPRLESGRP